MRPDAVLLAPGSAADLTRKATEEAFSFSTTRGARDSARGWIFGIQVSNSTAGLPAAESAIAFFTRSISAGDRSNWESCLYMKRPSAYTVFCSSVVRLAPAGAACLGAGAPVLVVDGAGVDDFTGAFGAV